MHMDFTPLNDEFKKIEKQSVTVGVLNHSVRAANIDHEKGFTTLSTGSGSVPRRFVKTKGRSSNIRLKKLAIILDADRGIFSSVLVNPNNRELVELAQDLAIFNKTARDIKRIENTARALVRNPILRKDYGPNAASTIHGHTTDSGYTFPAKGFDRYAFATGTLFKNIEAIYKKW